MNIEELKRLAEAATPGPWVPGLLSLSKGWIKGRLSEGVLTDSEYPIAACSESRDDASYIAAANPATVLELISHMQSLEATLRGAADDLKKAQDGEIKALRQRDELMAALKDARELVDDWGAYATAYMQEKHDLAGDLERLDAAISKVEEQS